MTWLSYALPAVALFTVLGLLARVLTEDSKNPRAFAVAFNIFSVLIASAIFFLFGQYKNFNLPKDVTSWTIILIACALYGGFERVRFYATKHLDASIYSTILTLSTLVAFVGSAFLYSEPITPNKLLGLTLIVVATVMVSYEKNKKSHTKGILAGFTAAILVGLAWMFDKLGTERFNAETYNIIVWFAPLFIVYYFPRVKTADVKGEIKRASWKIPLLSVVNVLGYFLQLKALEIAEATKVIPTIQTATLTTVIAGIFILKETDHIYKKFFAGLLATLGVYLIV